MELKTTLAVIGGTFVIAGTAAAAPASFSTNADVTILEQITIAENANLAFGSIDPPSSGTQTFTVDTSGGMTAGAGDGQAIGGHSAGEYDVNGSDATSYTFSVTAGACSDPGLTLGAMTDTNTGVLDDLGVQLGGELTVSAGTPPGSQTCAYTVNANY